jgi:autotransporter-associated beta strand protein
MKKIRSRQRMQRLMTALAAVTAFASASALFAEPRSWDGGAGSSLWTNGANWNPDGTPTSTSDVTLGAGVPAAIDLSSTAPGNPSNIRPTINSLVIATTGSFSIIGTPRPPAQIPPPAPQWQSAQISLITGTLTRQDLAGVEGNHSLGTILLLNNATWNVGGQGQLSANIATDGPARNFRKSGFGVLNLTSASHGGVTEVVNGVLRIGGPFQTSSIITYAGTELQLAGITTTGGVGLANGEFGQPASILRNVSGNSSIGVLGLADGANPIYVDGSSTLSVAGYGGLFAFGMNKHGTGTLISNAPSSFFGTSIVREGVLQADHNQGLGSGPVEVLAGATLAVGNNATISNSINVAGSLGTFSAPGGFGTTLPGIGAIAGPITLNANTTLSAPLAPDVLTIGGSIHDGGRGFGLTKTGAGTVIMSGTSDYLGATTVTAGILRLTSPSAVPNRLVVVHEQASLELSNGHSFSLPTQIGGMGLDNKGVLRSVLGANTHANTISLFANAAVGAAEGASLTLSGQITGNNFKLINRDAGTVNITALTTDLSALDIEQGILSFSPASIPAAPITVRTTGSLSLAGNQIFNNSLHLSGDGSSTSIGELDNQSGNNSWVGQITFGDAASISVRGGRLAISGNITGALPLSKTGPGELALAGTNTHGDTSIAQGILTAQSPGALPSGRSVFVSPGTSFQLKGGVTTGAGANLRLAGQGTALEGAMFNAQQNNTFAGNVLLSPDSTIGVAAGTTLTLTGNISDDHAAAPLPLLKSGPGRLHLAGTNSLRAGAVINGGILSIDADSRLGDPLGQVLVNHGGRLLLAENTTATARTFILNTGSLQVESGAELHYQGATVSGGFLRGPGTHVLDSASSFNGVTALVGAEIVQQGQAELNNFTNAARFTSTAPLFWDGGFNGSAGTFIVNSAASIAAVTNDGRITINSGGTLESSNILTSGGGSRITINSGGRLDAVLDLNGALLVNNGTVSGRTTVNFGSLAKGAGVYGRVDVTDGGRFSPGNSPGSVTTGSTTWNSGGHYLVEIADALSAAGRDFWQVEGQLILNASPEKPFTISLASLDGLIFDPARDHSWTILHATGGISGFDPTEVYLDTSSFRNSIGAGHFSIQTSATDIAIHFSAVPEPATLALMAAMMLLTTRRRQFHQEGKL